MRRRFRYCVYILKCRDGTFYTGCTNNLQKRLDTHNKGQGAKYLRGKLPVELIYAKEYPYSKTALKAEREIKKLTRRQKEIFILTSARKFRRAVNDHL